MLHCIDTVDHRVARKLLVCKENVLKLTQKVQDFPFGRLSQPGVGGVSQKWPAKQKLKVIIAAEVA